MIKKIVYFILSFVIIFSPTLLVFGAGLVPDCNTGEIDPITGSYKNACDFNALMEMINKVIDFVLFKLATPIFALIIVYVGWLYLSDMGNSRNVEKSKSIFKNALFGYVIALIAWLIVTTIMKAVGFRGPTFLN